MMEEYVNLMTMMGTDIYSTYQDCLSGVASMTLDKRNEIFRQCSRCWIQENHQLNPYVQRILHICGVSLQHLKMEDASEDDLRTVKSACEAGNPGGSLTLLNSKVFPTEFIKSLNNEWVRIHLRVKDKYLAA